MDLTIVLRGAAVLSSTVSWRKRERMPFRLYCGSFLIEMGLFFSLVRGSRVCFTKGVRVCVCVYIDMCVWIHVYMYVYRYISVCMYVICMYVCLYTCIYIYTRKKKEKRMSMGLCPCCGSLLIDIGLVLVCPGAAVFVSPTVSGRKRKRMPPLRPGRSKLWKVSSWLHFIFDCQPDTIFKNTVDIFIRAYVATVYSRLSARHYIYEFNEYTHSWVQWMYSFMRTVKMIYEHREYIFIHEYRADFDSFQDHHLVLVWSWVDMGYTSIYISRNLSKRMPSLRPRRSKFSKVTQRLHWNSQHPARYYIYTKNVDAMSIVLQ